jgi:hypothetical protein
MVRWIQSQLVPISRSGSSGAFTDGEALPYPCHTTAEVMLVSNLGSFRRSEGLNDVAFLVW